MNIDVKYRKIVNYLFLLEVLFIKTSGLLFMNYVILNTIKVDSTKYILLKKFRQLVKFNIIFSFFFKEFDEFRKIWRKTSQKSLNVRTLELCCSLQLFFLINLFTNLLIYFTLIVGGIEFSEIFYY